MADELFPFTDEADDLLEGVGLTGLPPWKVLVVDDDPEVHSVTRFVLHNLQVQGRSISLLNAYSGNQARAQLRAHPDIAVALLDVVMETERSGLELVGYIRDELKRTDCRLILRTGQPGYAPELTVIRDYDINDYRTKAELTHTRLVTTVSAALRAYQQLQALAEHRRGLELIVGAAADLMEQRAISSLAEGILTQLAALLKLPLDGIVCTQRGMLTEAGGDGDGCYVVGAAGRHAPYIARPLDVLPDERIVGAIHEAARRREHVFGPDYTVLYLKAAPHPDAILFLEGDLTNTLVDRALLELFLANATACFRNVDLIERLQDARQQVERQRVFLSTVIDADPHAIYVKNRAGQLILANQGLARSLGLTPEQMIGKTFSDLIDDPERLKALLEDDQAILTQQMVKAERETKLTDPSGKSRWFYTVKGPIKNEAGDTDLIGVSIDITARKQAELDLIETQERVLVTLHSIGDAVITTDANARVDYLNPVAEVLTGWARDEARGRSLTEVFRVVDEHHSNHPAPNPVAHCLKEGRIVQLTSPLILISRDGKEYYIDDSAAPIYGSGGQLLGAVLVFHDVTETRQLTRKLEYDATHDALTGLINRMEFERRLDRAVASAHQYGARHVLCYLDLDQFKIVNDTAGHAAGDELLRQINVILSGMFRDRDTLARIGGDEFGLLLENCPLERAQLIAQTVVTAIREYRFCWEGCVYQIGVSIGLAAITAETESTAQLLTQADVACYIAKETGRNRAHIYQREDTETAQRHSEILGAAGLRDALEHNRFRLHYQPMVSLQAAGYPITRYEALLRVAYKSRPNDASELVLPAAFIPAAERYGFMGAIDRWVVQTALRDYADGVGQTGGRITINLSSNSLSDEAFLAFVKTQFAEYAFPPERLCFDITEHAAIQSLRCTTELMMALKDHGCEFALDDFGSGVSSFRYLKSLPVDYLKIDGSFIKDMDTNSSDRALVAAINQMSHTLGIATVAEYTHNRAIVEQLRDMGVDYAQGYYFSEPMPWGALV